jgi:general L-amino acid transport system permease protein
MAEHEITQRADRAGAAQELPPPATTVGVFGWLWMNLFSSPLNAVLTLGALFILYVTVPPFIQWAFIDADWTGETRDACSREGACWVYVIFWFKQLMYGRYPDEELWRINAAYLILVVAAIPLFVPGLSWKRWVGAFLLFVYPVIAFFLFVGDSFGLAAVDTPLWGGLFLTLVIATVGIVASLPIGIVLALGRRSDMPIVKALCIGFIELWRGVPLITVLFMASVMFPLFMPEGVNFDKLLRALIAVMLFSAAYLAETVRGGLQAIPKGQYEAAQALGLSYWKMMGLIVLPQALKLVIPGIVNSFIALFKDTTLVLIIGLFDLLGMVQLVGTNPSWLGFATEGYVFVAFMFWMFCFGMSRYSQHLERKLHTGY